jgi:hypothetical protein
MIHVVRVTELDQLMDIFSDQGYREDIDRNRCLYVYRGMSNTSFTLETSLERNCKDKKDILERSILRNFKKYAIIDDPEIEKSIWRQMIVGQHHGLPTRLLDWSYSSLVALHFATSEADMDQMNEHDCMVWRIDIKELHRMLPEKYQKLIEETKSTVFSVKMMTKACSGIEQYDEDMQDKSMVVMEPPSIDSRIVNQYSFFSVVPAKILNLEDFLNRYTDHTYKYIIDKSIRWRVRDMLDQLNINERIVYPGLDGISRWIARHYFVKGQDICYKWKPMDTTPKTFDQLSQN